MEKGGGNSFRQPSEKELADGTKEYISQLEARQKLSEQKKQEEEEEKKPSFNPGLIAKYLKGKLQVGRLTVQKGEKREPVSFFDKGSIDACDFAQLRSNVTFDFDFKGDIPAEGVTLSFCDAKVLRKFKFPDEYEKVTLVTCVSTQYDNTKQHEEGESKEISGALNIRHDYKPYANEQKDYFEMQQSMGALPYACFDFAANKKEERQQFALRTQYVQNKDTGQRVFYHAGNPAFVATVGYIDGADPNYGAVYFKKEKEDCTQEELKVLSSSSCDDDKPPCLFNGIVYLPGHVCREAGLLLYNEEKAREAHLKSTNNKKEKDDDNEDHVQDMDCGSDNEEEDDIPEEEYKTSKFLGAVDDENRIRCWFAIDPQHILLWPIKDTKPEVLRGAGMHVQTFDISTSEKSPLIRLCYLVSDVTLRGLIRSYSQSWANKTDFRNFNDIGITIAPASKTMGTISNYHIQFRVVCFFIFWKSLSQQQQPRLKPVIHSDLPSFLQFVETPMDKLAHDFTARLRI
jgi:hypothetical protein